MIDILPVVGQMEWSMLGRLEMTSNVFLRLRKKMLISAVLRLVMTSKLFMGWAMIELCKKGKLIFYDLYFRSVADNQEIKKEMGVIIS